MPPPHVLTIAIDGLRASALGAYGSVIETPSLNRFASQAELHDWVFADSPELNRVYGSFWEGKSPLSKLLASGGYQSVLASDDPAIASLPTAKAFDAIVELTAPLSNEPAESLATTWLAGFCGELAEVIVALVEQTAPDRPQFLWAHTRGLTGPWDAPVELIAAQLDEEDPEVESSTTPATGVVTGDDPDASFSAACRYAAQVGVLDACLGQLLELVSEQFAGKPLVIALVGVRGYALGEHGVIGLDDRLYAETLHTPLMIRHGDGRGALARRATPTGSASLLGQILPNPVKGEPDSFLVQTSEAGAAAVQRGEWRLIRPAASSGEPPAARLYLKPDDRWEANDVASLMPETVEQLEALLAPAADLAPSSDSK